MPCLRLLVATLITAHVSAIVCLEGFFADPGHKGGRVQMQYPQYDPPTDSDKGCKCSGATGAIACECGSGEDAAIQEGGLRACGDGWIIAMVSQRGNICARVTKGGEITAWEVIEESVGVMPGVGDMAKCRMNRIQSSASRKGGD